MGNVKTEVQVLTALVAATGVVAAASAALAPRPWANSSWRRARKPLDDKDFNHSVWEGAQQGAVAVGGEASYIETQSGRDYGKNVNA
ncbi:MAG: hypothetical protein F4226_09435 [Synechococcus sp. SB0678_bin_12]|nr:hypothetical protein [Cyanobacteria bacterium MAG IRC1_bin_28]MYF36977.1 hypothetical protein [Synechococcus sp. SB0678_bin_12]